MQSANRTRNATLKMVQLTIFAALVVVLQWVGGFIHIGPVSLSLVLIPIVIGAVLLGPLEGMFLGSIFGLITVVGGVSGADYFTNFLFQDQPVLTVILCFVKAMLAGLCAGLVFRAVRNWNRLVAVFLASAVAPIVNTGIFVLGTLTLFQPTLQRYIFETDLGGISVMYFVVILCAGLNFLAEFVVNLIASPAIYRIWTVLAPRERGRT